MNVCVKSWTIKFRDYPQLALDVKDMTLWGRLIGAEIEGAKRGNNYVNSFSFDVDMKLINFSFIRFLLVFSFCFFT